MVAVMGKWFRFIKLLKCSCANKTALSTSAPHSFIIASLCLCNLVFAQVQLGEDIDGESSEDRSGYAVSLSADGQRLAIGAPWNDGNGDDAGHVRVYEWSGTAWLPLGADIEGETANDHSGMTASLSADGRRAGRLVMAGCRTGHRAAGDPAVAAARETHGGCGSRSRQLQRLRPLFRRLPLLGDSNGTSQ